jgi:hypothetical protein
MPFSCDGYVSSFSGTAIRKLEFPSSVGRILKFDNCPFLETVEFAGDECLKEIDGFRDGDRLREVVIPKSVEPLSQECFSDCNQLSNVWLSLDGHLSRVGGLSRIPIASIEILDSVQLITGLCGGSGLKAVTFGPGNRLREIQGFEGCGFVEVELPDSVEIVGHRAFQSEVFRMIKVGEKSRVRRISRQDRWRPHKFCLTKGTRQQHVKG